MNEAQNTTLSSENNGDGMTEIIGVRFKEAGKVYFFDPRNFKVTETDCVIVETARGMEFGFVASANHMVASTAIVSPLRPVIRIASRDDIDRYTQNKQLEKDAFPICQEKIREHGLNMKLIEAEYTFDNSKLIFYYSAESRVDFRELAKDLASIFRTRIELRQIGTRDEAKMIGGLGICGRPFCCSSFLQDFMQISIKMAKEQNLSLNSSKISGTCGKLMCCLRYELEVYNEEQRLTPPNNATVKTPDGIGTVISSSPLAGTVKVRLKSETEETVRQFHRDELTVIPKESGGEKAERGEKGKARNGDKTGTATKAASERGSEKKTERNEKTAEKKAEAPAVEAEKTVEPAAEE